MKILNKVLLKRVGLSLLLVFSSLWVVKPVYAFNPHEPFDISSDLLEYDDATQNVTAQGHVVVVQSSSTLNADLVRYDRVHKQMIARGKVVLREKGNIFLGEQLDYDLEQEKGLILGAKAYGSPWLFQGASWEKNKDYYIGRHASFTSCDLIDPHYHIRSSRVHLIPDRLFWAWNNVFYVDKHPIFYTPFLYKALGPRRIVFQVEPGNDSVKGAFAKTTTTMRFTNTVYDKVFVDYYSTSGIGYGNEFNYRGKDYKGSLFGYYIDPKGRTENIAAPSGEQYNIRAYHWQKLNHDTIFQSNVNHRKNVSFNNEYFTQDPNQAVTNVANSIAVTHQKGHVNQRLLVQGVEDLDSGASTQSGDLHIQTASIPRYEATLYQIPLWKPIISTNTLDQVLHPVHLGVVQLTAIGAAEDFYARSDKTSRLRANTSATVSESINLSRKWSFTPSLTPSLRWQDKYDPFTPPTVTTPTVIVIPIGIFRGYQGRIGTSHNLRFRPVRSLTLDQTYNLTYRLAPNATTLDRGLQDGGVETNHLDWLLFMRPSRLVLWRSYSGYDLRNLADEDPTFYRQRRVDPWTNEITFMPRQSAWDYFVRYQLGYYPTRARLWEVDVKGRFAHRTSYQTGLSFNESQRGFVTWNNKVGFYVSPSWRVDTILNVLMPNRSLSSIKGGNFIQSEFVVTRDMHCWTAQFSYRNLPPFTRQYSVLFNLKLGAQAVKAMTDQELEEQFYPWRAAQ